MINAGKRLSTFKNDEVRHIFRSAVYREKFMGLDLLLAPSFLSHGRILVVTSKKTGNAAKRNLIRRRLKAIFYEEQLFEKQLDIIIIIKKEGIGKSFDELKSLLLQAVTHYEETQQSNSNPA